MNLIKCQNLSLTYNKKTIVSNINLEIKEKDFLAIIGSNGVGKSTFIKTLLGLKKDYLGTINFENLKMTNIGYLAQHINYKNDFPASVYEVVLSATLNQAKLFSLFYTRKEKKLVNQYLEKLNILELKSKSFNDLSEGQKQKVLFARSLCAANKMLVIDEANKGFDQKSNDNLYELLKELNDGGLSIVMVSHDLAKVSQYASKVLKIEDDGSVSLIEDLAMIRKGL